MRFGMLGELSVQRADGTAVDLGRRQQRLVLARLLVDAGRTVAVDRLVDDLWGEHPPAGAVGTLQAYVSRLRRVLEPDRAPGAAARVLVTRGAGYALLVDAGAVDATRFEALAARGRDLLGQGRAREAVDAFDEALGLWRGDVLAECADEPFAAPLIARLTALRDDAAEQRAAALLSLGDTAPAIADLELLVAGDQLRERSWELLLCALHATGRTVEALERYRGLREHLVDELGLDPGPGLQAVEATLLRGERPAAVGTPRTPPAPVASRPRADALVGRAQEQAALKEAFTSALEGRTAWAVLVGEAGIGKTRLVRDLAEHAEAAGARVVVGACHAADVTPAFWPWVQVLRGLDDLIPGAGALLEADTPTTGDTAARLFSLFDRVAGALRAAARHLPLLVVVEDLHWADEESLQLVDFLAVQLRDVPLVIALTSRRDEGAAAVRGTLTELARQPGAVRLDLEGLDPAATGALLATLTGRAVDDATAEGLRERTGGNPFFVTELARLGEAALTSAVLPDTVREVLARRLATLPTDAVRLLALAAVHGAEFGLEALVATSEAEEGEVLDQLDVALSARLLVPTDDPGRFRFAHALVREAALDGVPDLRRRRLHLRIAAALRALTPEDPTAWRAEVAHHLLAAAPLGDAREALDAARAAAELADARLAYHEAARWWAGALRVLDWDRALGADQRVRHDLLVALGRSLGDAGDRPAALQRLAEAIDVAHGLGDARAMAAAAISFERTGGFWYWTEYGVRPVELLERLDRVLAALPDDLPELRVRVLAVAAAGEYYGDQARGRALSDAALALARDLGDPELICVALVSAMRTRWTSAAAGVPQQHARAQELHDLAVAARLPEMELLAATFMLTNHLLEGNLEASEAAWRRATALSQQLGLVLFQAQLAWVTPIFPFARGDLDRAAQLQADAAELHARTRLYAREVIVAWNHVARALVADDLGAITAEERARYARVYPEGEALLRLHVDGDVAGARALLIATVQSQPLRPLFDTTGLAVIRARLIADLGCVDLALDHLSCLDQAAGLLGVFGTCCVQWPVAIELGRLQWLVGERDAARATLEAVHARCEDAGWPRWGELARRALDEVAAPSPAEAPTA